MLSLKLNPNLKSSPGLKFYLQNPTLALHPTPNLTPALIHNPTLKHGAGLKT